MSKKTKKQDAKVAERAIVKAAPAAKASVIKGAPTPKINNRPNGCMVIKHTEYCTDIYQNGFAAAPYTYRVNPQNSELFPWLSAIATRFEMYKFKKLKFSYTPSCATTVGGYVAIGFDFDFTDYSPGNTPSKATMLTWKYSTKSAPWEHCNVDVSVDANKAVAKYCDTSRTDSVTTFDPRFDNLGLLIFFACNTGASSNFIGELFVEYEVEFMQPAYKLPQALWLTVKSTVNLPGADQPFAGNVASSGNINFDRNPAEPGSITIKDAGKFIIQLIETGTAITSSLNALSISLFNGTVADTIEVIRKYSSDGTKSYLQNILDVKVPPVKLNFSGGNGLGLSSDFKVMTYSPN